MVAITPRGGTGTEIGVAFFASLISSALDNSPACATSFGEGVEFNLYQGKASNGKIVQTCWTNNSNNLIFEQAGVNVAKCLIDTHSKQAGDCFSTKGSFCDGSPGYVEAGGRLQNIRLPDLGNSDKLGVDQATAYEDAVDWINGITVNGLDKDAEHGGPYMFIVNEDGTETTEYPQVQFNFFGGRNTC